MDVQLLECNKIEFPKTEGELRTFSKDFARSLAVSIKNEGQFNPIAVRPNPAKPGFYIGFQGKHRWYAIFRVLKEQFINANVLLDMDETDVEMAQIAENLWRNPLTKVQHTKALKKWWNYYSAKHPDKVGSGSAGGAASAAKRAEKAKGEQSETGEAVADDAAKSVDGGEAASENSEAVASFTEMVAAATGRSASSVDRDARVAKTFTEDQLEVFDQMKVSQTDMITIAKIKDEADRGGVINLIAAGMEADEAVKSVMKDKAPTRATGKSKAEEEGKSAAKAEKVSELSDDEWFERFCGAKAKLLTDPTRYKGDALLFRKLSDLRHAFRSKAKASLKAAKDSGAFGPLYHLFNRFTSVSHPEHWLLCDGCGGTGKKPDGTPCTRCSTGGYLLKTEVYL